MTVPDAVIDVSAMIEVFVGENPEPQLRKRVLLGQLAVPELFDVEMLSVLRKLERAGKLTPEIAQTMVAEIANSPVARTPHRPLLDRIWELRHSVRPYDGAYIALAESLEVPLITCDAKLAGSNGHAAKFEVYPTTS